ncbi:77.2 kDa [Spodoptera frugiperda ascovirus 1a]|uniref:77.2 kDa n=1 Tax=Spodoptera frugiperda ascovirus 1a TaxID=113370 RepID=Q0E574_SFAVA|nr:77.2 kDa [Spodoptera frugiperda ascovirus 1a]CAL44627.1 77.2 kDa [Spodoptera frugiperda ascovirus 1a]
MTHVIRKVSYGPMAVVLDDWPTPVNHAGYVWESVSHLLSYIDENWETNTSYLESLRHITLVVVGHALYADDEFRSALATTGYRNLEYRDFDSVWSKHSKLYTDSLQSYRRQENVFGEELRACRRVRNALSAMCFDVDVFRLIASNMIEANGGNETHPSYGGRVNDENDWAYGDDVARLRYKQFDVFSLDRFITESRYVDMSKYRVVQDDRPLHMQRIYSTVNEMLYDVFHGDGTRLLATLIETCQQRRYRAIIDAILKVDRLQRDGYDSLTGYVPVNRYVYSKGSEYYDRVLRLTQKLVDENAGVPESLMSVTASCWPRTDYELDHLKRYATSITSKRPATLQIEDDSPLYPVRAVRRRMLRIDDVVYASIAHAVVLLSVVYHMKVSNPKDTVIRYGVDVDVLPAISETVRKSRGQVWYDQGARLVHIAANSKFNDNPWLYAEIAMVSKRYGFVFNNDNRFTNTYATGDNETLDRSVRDRFVDVYYTSFDTFAGSTYYSIENSPLSRHVLLCIMSKIHSVNRNLVGTNWTHLKRLTECTVLLYPSLLIDDDDSIGMRNFSDANVDIYRDLFRRANNKSELLSDQYVDSLYSLSVGVIEKYSGGGISFVESCHRFAADRALQNNESCKDRDRIAECLNRVCGEIVRHIRNGRAQGDVGVIAAAAFVLRCDEE